MTTFISQQNIDKQKLSIFLRDLAGDVKVNLKHMIEDNLIDNEKKKKGNKKKGKKHQPKKKDIIIQQQNEKRKKKNIEDDMGKMDFLFNNMDVKKPFLQMKNLKTDEGIMIYKFRLLDFFWKDKVRYMDYIILLFFELKNMDVEDENNINLLKEINDILEESDYKIFMMKNLGHMLPPLNYWDTGLKQFDDWQKNVINYVDQKKSVIVRAPTSSGKTFIAMSTGIIHKKIIYICPAKPVAYQVGANFIKMGYKVHFLLDNLSHYSYNSQTNIFIGTPLEVEDYLNKVGISFDYAVFDEIHNLNKEDDGHIYENIIKLLPCNFLALSATIKNVDYLREIFEKIHPQMNIEYVEYNKRFINHNRWIWKDGQLKQLHPLCAFNTIEDNFKEIPLQFTPNNCATLWEKIEEILEEIDEENDLLDDCSPDEYFTESKLLSLDDCKEYEIFLKEKLLEWNKDYPKEIQEIFDSFKIESVNDDESNIIDFIRTSKKKDMFPMLMFNTDENICKGVFEDIYNYLDKKELEEYPYHYEILEKKDELYTNYLNKREQYKSNIKITSTNAQFEIKDKMDDFERKEKTLYIKGVLSFYESKFLDIENVDDENIKKIQKKNLKKEMDEFILNPDFCHQDIFKKHNDFIFTDSNEPMSGETIRDVRREIKKTLGIKVPYESPLFQMLKRGIGLYIENAPDEYNWILQKLLSKKEIGIVISDKTLCLGIDLPVRTSCFLGIKGITFTKDEYLQMSGRAGRRGLDNKGNIIFYGNIDYLSLMRSELPEIVGSTKNIYENYRIMDKKNFNEKLFENMVNPQRKYEKIDNFKIPEENVKLLWFLREYGGALEFITNLMELEVELFRVHENDKEKVLLDKIIRLVKDKDNRVKEYYKLKKIDKYDDIKVVKEHMKVIKHIHNSVNNRKYMILVKTSKVLFDDLNKMIYGLII
tara:strand:- start:22932 stop:25730 length:2799 start_codon:yes stop_codon:yes gene_type:complete